MVIRLAGGHENVQRLPKIRITNLRATYPRQGRMVELTDEDTKAKNPAEAGFLLKE